MNNLFSILASGLCVLVLACGNDNGGDVIDAGTATNDMDASEPGVDAGCDVDPTFTSLSANIFSTLTCASASCHGNSNDLTLSGSQATVYAEVMGMTVDTTARVNFPQRVVAMQPQQSFLYLKLSEDAPPGGSRMPLVCDFTGTCLTSCQQAAVETWIANGANND